MKMKVKVSLIFLTIISLSACSTLELVHVPVDCLGQPQINVTFTQQEADTMSIETVKKIALIRNTLKARINAQCNINNKHDRLHGDN